MRSTGDALGATFAIKFNHFLSIFKKLAIGDLGREPWWKVRLAWSLKRIDPAPEIRPGLQLFSWRY
jgi:hypothetical protein